MTDIKKHKHVTSLQELRKDKYHLKRQKAKKVPETDILEEALNTHLGLKEAINILDHHRSYT